MLWHAEAHSHEWAVHSAAHTAQQQQKSLLHGQQPSICPKTTPPDITSGLLSSWSGHLLAHMSHHPAKAPTVAPPTTATTTVRAQTQLQLATDLCALEAAQHYLTNVDATPSQAWAKTVRNLNSATQTHATC